MSENSPDANRRRRKIPSTANEVPLCRVSQLPDHVLNKCFSFLGPGHYRFVAGTCHWFRDVYSEKQGENKATFWENVIKVSCENLVLDDYKLPEKSPYDVNHTLQRIALKAVMMERFEVLLWFLENSNEYKTSVYSPSHYVATQAIRNGQVRVLE